MSLGENIYKYRTGQGMSQGALADCLEVSRQSVSKWENDSATPELEKLIRMCRTFDVSLDELVFGQKPQAAVPPPQTHFIIRPRVAFGIFTLLFGMVFFLLSVFWGNQLKFGEEFGELLSISIVLVSTAIVATHNKTILAGCFVIYFIYGVLCSSVLHVTSMTNYIFLFFAGIVLLVWFIILGLDENKKPEKGM